MSAKLAESGLIDSSHIVVVIRGQAQVFQQIISQSIAQVSTIQLQSEELDGCQKRFWKIVQANIYHDTEPRQQMQIRLEHNLTFLGTRPCCLRIKSVFSFVRFMRRQCRVNALASNFCTNFTRVVEMRHSRLGLNVTYSHD